MPPVEPKAAQPQNGTKIAATALENGRVSGGCRGRRATGRAGPDLEWRVHPGRSDASRSRRAEPVGRMTSEVSSVAGDAIGVEYVASLSEPRVAYRQDTRRLMEGYPMSRMPRVFAMVCIVVGGLAIAGGIVTWSIVRYQLSEQHITVSSDAPFLAGKDVKGPFTAFAQAAAINKHALKAGNGKTYAELPQDDPNRQTVMTADFLQASLYTSVVAFGLAALVIALGAMFVLLGVTLRVLDRRTAGGESGADATELASASAPAS